MSNLIEFYGDECSHCITMKPIVEKLEKELNIEIEKIEVWHNEANSKKLEELDKGRCGGVPFFINTKTDEVICGAADYERLKNWALGK